MNRQAQFEFGQLLLAMADAFNHEKSPEQLEPEPPHPIHALMRVSALFCRQARRGASLEVLDATLDQMRAEMHRLGKSLIASAQSAQDSPAGD